MPSFFMEAAIIAPSRLDSRAGPRHELNETGEGDNVLTLSEELSQLQQANDHIAAAIRRIEIQRTLIASMAGNGEERALAEALLATMQATLKQFTCHRDAIVENIVRLRVQDVQKKGG